MKPKRLKVKILDLLFQKQRTREEIEFQLGWKPGDIMRAINDEDMFLVNQVVLCLREDPDTFFIEPELKYVPGPKEFPTLQTVKPRKSWTSPDVLDPGTFEGRVRMVAESLGVSINDLCKNLGLSIPTFYAAFRQERGVSFESLLKFANSKLTENVNIDWLVSSRGYIFRDITSAEEHEAILKKLQDGWKLGIRRYSSANGRDERPVLDESTFGGRLIAVLKHKNINARNLSQKLGLSSTNIHLLAQNQRNPGKKFWDSWKACEWLKEIDIAWLGKGKGQMLKSDKKDDQTDF